MVTPLTQGQLSVLHDVCSYRIEGAEYKSMAFKNKSKGSYKWDGNTRLFNAQTRRFPIGLLYLICNTFRSVGIQVNIINKRKSCDIIQLGCIDMSTIELREYQRQAVISSLMYGNGVIKAATGSGKTTIAAMTIHGLSKKTVFVVHTRDLLYQTMVTFQRLFPNEIIGRIGDGVIDYQNITVATMQSLAILSNIEYKRDAYDEDNWYSEIKIEADDEKRRLFKEYCKSVGVVMYDEVQRVCSRTAYSTRFLFERANHAFGYSASPWRDDGSDLLINAAFGERIVDIDASSLIKQGYLVQPEIRIRQLQINLWEGKNYVQVYKSAIVENMFRNLQVCNDAYQQWQMGRNTLILVTQIQHGEILEQILKSMNAPAVFISGKSGMKKRKHVIEGMRNGTKSLVIASTIADVGLDVPRLQSIIEAGAGKSSVTALQRLGRIMRPFPNKDKCYFITYHDRVPYIINHIDRKIEIWSTEPGFEIIIEQ